MAWKDTLLEASFRGAIFDCIRTDDSADRSVAEHAYPYIDGADIEDLGRGPRKVSTEAIFYGDDYEQRLRHFIQVLDEPGEGDLIHPVFGVMFAQLTSYRIRHEADNIDQASITLEFTESTPSQPFFDHKLASQKAAAIGQQSEAARAASAEAMAQVVDQTHAANPLAALDALRAAMTAPLAAALKAVNGVVASGLDVIAYPRAWASDIGALLGGALDLRNFIPGIANGLLNDLRDVSTLLDALFAPTGGSAPATLVPGRAPTEAQAVAAIDVNLSVVQATGHAEAVQAVLEAEADTASLSPSDIETMANDARTALQSAIDALSPLYPLETRRAIAEPLKDVALALQQAAQAIIEARPPLVVRTMDAPGNLRLIAHRLYGDHTRAPELFRLNNLRLPNFIQPGDKLNAYAS